MDLLQIKNLQIDFKIKKSMLSITTDTILAVKNVNLNIKQGECVGLVGSSAAGKSTVAKAIMGANTPTDSIFFNGCDITYLLKKKRELYRKNVQMIFQNPYSSLNPKKNVHDIILESIKNFEKKPKDQLKKYAKELLDIVGLPAAALEQYPKEFSGGGRQRICIARAIAIKPKLIVADEPVSALDVSIQAQILNYLQDINKNLGIAMLFISHDMRVIGHMCSSIAVMDQGSIVEIGTKEQIFTKPIHDSTKKLIDAMHL